MMKTLAVCSVLSFIIAGVVAQQMLAGSGKLTILSLSACEEKTPWGLDARRYRLNRTHEAITADLRLNEPIDDTCAIQIELCKMVEGGCKPYMTIMDESLPSFVKKHCEDKVRSAFECAGLDNPEFPIPAGEYHIKDFIVDMEGLPECLYGEYEVVGYVLKEGVKMACMTGRVNHEPKDDDGLSGFG